MTLGLGWIVGDENYCITIDIFAGTTSPENCMSLKKNWSIPFKKEKKLPHFQFFLPPDSSHDLLEDSGVDLEVEVVVLGHDLPADAAAQRLLYQKSHLLPCQVQYRRLLQYHNQFSHTI